MKPTINNSLLHWKNCFKQIYNKVYQQIFEYNMRAQINYNKHKLGKPLEIGQKILLKNHHIEIGKSKKLQNLI